jgi:flavin-dependent dehydrogenase
LERAPHEPRLSKEVRVSRVVIIGAGPAGLAAALFSARRGHQVTLIEPDAGPDGACADDDFDGWSRPGVAHARQGHVFLARSTEILRAEAPDVLQRLLQSGAVSVPIGDDSDRSNLLCRRLVYEAALRRSVAAQAGVSVLVGQRVRELVAREDSSSKTVTGVRCGRRGVIEGDIVLDASGRASHVSTWLSLLGARAPFEQRVACGFFYVTRHYRLKPDAEFPSTAIPIVVPLPYITVLAFPGDNRSFQVSVTVSEHDPYRKRLLDPEVFERVVSNLPIGAEWLPRGIPRGAPLAMGKIANCRRSLLVDGAPVVAGFGLLGDAALQTNPTTGRGVSCAFVQAQAAAEALDEWGDRPEAFTRALEESTRRRLGVWFDSQVAIDAERSLQLAAGVKGEARPPARDPTNRLISALATLSQEDERIRVATRRLYNLLMTPEDLLSDRAITQRVLSFLRTSGGGYLQSLGPDRRSFERFVSG